MGQDTKFNEPNRFEVIRSFGNADNTRLARKVFSLNAWYTYDRFTAHTWALRLIKADPKTGEDVSVALINYDYMIPGARQKYASNTQHQKRCDAILEAYQQWKSETAALAA